MCITFVSIANLFKALDDQVPPVKQIVYHPPILPADATPGQIAQFKCCFMMWINGHGFLLPSESRLHAPGIYSTFDFPV